MTVSMADAAKIHDVAQRHAFAFNNGLSHKDFFDVDKRMKSEEFKLLAKHCDKGHDILEVGCYTGINLLGLGLYGYTSLTGIDFVHGAIEWLEYKAREMEVSINTLCAKFPEQVDHLSSDKFDRIVLYDVLEHQLNVGEFLKEVNRFLKPDGQALILVPAGKEFYDCGHVAFFPDEECLFNVLDYFFDVQAIHWLQDSKKLFAICNKRP